MDIDCMITEDDILAMRAFVESYRNEMEGEIEGVKSDLDGIRPLRTAVTEEGQVIPWPDADQPADRLYSRSLEQNSDTAHWQMYDFVSASGNVTLAESDWGTGGNKYLALVRHNITGDKPTLKYASIATATSDELVGVDSAATPDYIGATGNDGVLRVGSAKLSYADGGNFVTLDVVESELSLANLGTRSWTNLSDTAATIGNDGDMIYNNAGTLTAVLPTDLLGLHWVQGDGENTCYGTGVGNASKTKVVDLASQVLKNGDWSVDNALTAGDEIVADSGGNYESSIGDVGNTRAAYFVHTTSSLGVKLCDDSDDVSITAIHGAAESKIGGATYAFEGDGFNCGTGGYHYAGTKVVEAQQPAVADATGAGDVVAQLNALLARIRTHGLIAT